MRTHEGLLGLIQAPKFAAASAHLHRAGVPFVSVLAHPETGAAWAARSETRERSPYDAGNSLGSSSSTGSRSPSATRDEAFIASQHAILLQV